MHGGDLQLHILLLVWQEAEEVEIPAEDEEAGHVERGEWNELGLMEV